MSEQISKELLKIMNSISDMENTISKIDAAIFIKKSNKIIQEKVAESHQSGMISIYG